MYINDLSQCAATQKKIEFFWGGWVHNVEGKDCHPSGGNVLLPGKSPEIENSKISALVGLITRPLYCNYIFEKILVKIVSNFRPSCELNP